MKKVLSIIIGFVALCSLISCKQELKTQVTETHPNGAKKKEVHYYSTVANPRRVILYSPEGKVKSDQFMNNGKPDSTMVIYHDNGNKLKEVTYIQNPKTKQELKHGKETTWYESGKIKSEVVYEQGLPQGKAVSYYEDGTKASETPFVGGEKEGEEMEWFPDGKMRKLITYSKGNRNGLYKEWYENGNPKKQDSYVDNVLDGICMTFHDNGKKETECTYRQGKLEGLKQEWYPTGRIAAKATYEKGVLVDGERF